MFQDEGKVTCKVPVAKGKAVCMMADVAGGLESRRKGIEYDDAGEMEEAS